jgi:threonine dehydratase
VELLEEAGPLDAVVTPVGGGGLISGTTLAVGALAPGVRVYGAEPEAAGDAALSLRRGELVAWDAPQTVADGLKVPLRGLTWHFVRTGVADILTVSEAEIVETMRRAWERMKLVIEPSSAVPLAAVLKHADLFAGQRVGVILTGGNVDLDRLPWQG